MNTSVRHRITVAAAVLAGMLLVVPGARAGGPDMTIGATEDAVHSPLLSIAEGEMSLVARAGFRAVRISQVWTTGERALPYADATSLRNVMTAAAFNDVQVYASVFNTGGSTPLSDTDQADFAAYAASVATTAPGIAGLIVGNEPNLNRYWLPQFNEDGSDAAAPAYESLLARTYDAVKAVAPKMLVLGGAVSPRGGDVPSIRPTHSPTAFIRDLGAAYRGSGRTLPIMDGFAFHPYEDHSSVAPATGVHPNTTTIALADYDKLVGLLGEAFDGTAQPGSGLPVYYDEFGVESAIPPAKQELYTGAEPAVTQPVPEETQAAYYRQAIQLAFCQPNVRGMFLFHAFDEVGLPGWQSGLYYADGTPKASLAPTREAMQESRRGIVAQCPGLQLPVRASATQRGSRLLLTCDLDCNYVAQLYRVPGHLIASGRGRAIGGRAKALALRVPKTAGSYRLRVSAAAAVNTGPASLIRISVRAG